MEEKEKLFVSFFALFMGFFGCAVKSLKCINESGLAYDHFKCTSRVFQLWMVTVMRTETCHTRGTYNINYVD